MEVVSQLVELETIMIPEYLNYAMRKFPTLEILIE